MNYELSIYQTKYCTNTFLALPRENITSEIATNLLLQNCN